MELEKKVEEARINVHECLLDNLNTAGAVDTLLKLIAAANRYMKQREVDQATSPPGKTI